MNDDQQLIYELALLTGAGLEDVYSVDKVCEKLAAFINDLVANDFNRLIGLLYRLDVSESKLKTMLAENTGTDAGFIIADAIIKRQQEKIKSRAAFSKRNDDIPDEERW